MFVPVHPLPKLTAPSWEARSALANTTPRAEFHADLKAQALALGEIHSEDLAGGKAQGHPEAFCGATTMKRSCRRRTDLSAVAPGQPPPAATITTTAPTGLMEHCDHAFDLSTSFCARSRRRRSDKDHLNDRHKHRRRDRSSRDSQAYIKAGVTTGCMTSFGGPASQRAPRRRGQGR